MYFVGSTGNQYDGIEPYMRNVLSPLELLEKIGFLLISFLLYVVCSQEAVAAKRDDIPFNWAHLQLVDLLSQECLR